jgi:hypothetical protein
MIMIKYSISCDDNDEDIIDCDDNDEVQYCLWW